jgi:hypothetical protein
MADFVDVNAKARVTIGNFQAMNIGNGKTVDLSWSVPDPSLVRYFIVEMWDLNTRRWVPYDGFHGYLSAANNNKGAGPPQRVVFDVPFLNATVSFRIKSVGIDKTETDWAQCSVEVKVSGEEYSETSNYFCKSGLDVSNPSGYNIKIKVGAAYLGGARRYLARDTDIRLPSGYNKSYVAYINKDGVVSHIEGNTTPSDAIRLANVVVDGNGSVTVTDTRFLWAPSGLEVTQDPELGRLEYHLEWNTYDELNLKSWKIYRGIGTLSTEPPLDSFKAIAILDKQISSYDDDKIAPGIVYYYTIRAVDYGDNESSMSPAIKRDALAEDFYPPAIPVGLAGVSDGNSTNVWIDLTWDHNIESNLAGYRVWYKKPGFTYWNHLANVPVGINTYKHQGLLNGTEYSYCISAFNAASQESDKGDLIEVIAGDTLPPKAPVWAFVDPITTDFEAPMSYYAWVKLDWDPVTQNDDNTPINDLAAYRVYEIDGGGIRHLAEIIYVAENPLTEVTIHNRNAGANYTFVIRAVDKWGNQSVESSQKTILAGGLVPKAPVLVSVFAVGDKIKVVFNKVTQYEDNSIIDDLTGYVIFRGYSEANQSEVGRIQAFDPQSNTYEFFDSTVTNGIDYWYAVRAHKGNAFSEPSISSHAIAGDQVPPTDAVWDDATTRVNNDATIDNILEWTTGQEEDLKGTWIYVMRSGVGIYELLQFVPKHDLPEYKYIHEDVSNGLTYNYALVTEDTSGNVANQVVRSVVAGTNARPSAPVVTAAGIFEISSGIRLTWSEVTTNDDATPTAVTLLKGYRIYRSTSGFSYILVTDIPAGSSNYEYEDMELVNGKTYSYRVIAYSALSKDSLPEEVLNVVAGNIIPPDQPAVVHSLVFSPSSPSVVVVNLGISSLDVPASYKIYISQDNVRWAEPETVLYDADGSVYSYTIPYGSTSYYKVTAVSVPGVEGSPRVGQFEAVYDSNPSDILASDITITLETTSGSDFNATIDWNYNAQGNELDYFSQYDLLFNSATPVVLTSITDSDTRTYKVQGLKADIAYSFAAVVQDVFGLRSIPRFATIIPTDATVPKSPGSVTTSGRVLSVSAEWTPVTQNVDETSCNDLSYYLVEVADNIDFNPIARTANVQYMSNSYVFDTNDTSKTWYFRIKAVDRYEHISPTWTISSGAIAIDLTEFINGTEPEPPVLVSPLTTGVIWPNDNSATPVPVYDESPNVWVRLEWNAVANADHYNVYQSIDGSMFYQVAQCKTTNYTVPNLLARTNYWFKVSGVGKLNDEGELSNAVSCLTSAVIRNLPEPDNFGVTIGKSMLAVHWDAPIATNNVVLETRSTLDPQGTEPRTFTNWEVTYIGKGTSYIHPSLEYNRFYQYRIKAVDSSGNESIYAPSDYLTREYTPDQIGNADIALNAIYGNQVFANTITAVNIAPDSITASHIQAGTITAEKLAAGTIKAQNIDVTMGGFNYIKNSAFGITDLSGQLGLDWTLSSSLIVLDENIPFTTKYYVEMYKQYGIDPERNFYQTIPGNGLDGRTMILTWHRWSQNVTGTQCIVEVTINTSTGSVIETKTLSGTTDWVREELLITMPDNVVSVVIKPRIFGDSVGRIRFTQFQLEDGDIETQWNPHADEIYGAGGHVQISSAGIRIYGGYMDIESTDGSVKINGAGITAIKSFDGEGNPLRFAKLDGEGLTIKGGAFSISTAYDPTEATPLFPSRVEIDENGIRAFQDGFQTLSVGANGRFQLWNGELSFLPPLSATPAEGKIIINNEGLKAFSDAETETLRIESETGKLSLFGGNFEIKTAAESISNQGIIFNANTLSAYKSNGNRFFNIDNLQGKVFLYAGGFDISTAPEGQLGNRMSLDGSGITVYDETGLEKVVQISGNDIAGEGAGIKVLLKGGFRIRSSSPGNTVTIDENGILGQFENSSFELTRGHDQVPAGLHITNGVFDCGDVHIGPEGITVAGTDGITIKTDDATPIDLVKINADGINVLEDKGISLIGSANPDAPGGSICFYPAGIGGSSTVAINAKTGIQANAIKAGVLTITGVSGADNNPRIEVLDGETVKVNIDKSGINIFDGALSVRGIGNQVYIENGQVLAQGLRVGIGGSNLIKNGRAGKPSVAPWLGITSNAIVTNFPIPGSDDGSGNPVMAGVSGNSAFHFTLASPNAMSQTVTEHKVGSKYVLSCWVYLTTGSFNICAKRDDGSDIVTPYEVNTATNPDVSVNEYIHVVVRIPALVSDDIPITYKFVSTAPNTDAYITDIMVTMGDMSTSWANHSSEIESTDKNVLINDDGLTITNGKFSLITGDVNNKITIDGVGIRHVIKVDPDGDLVFEDKTLFELTDTGFSLNFNTQEFKMNEDEGLLIKEDNDHFVQLIAKENPAGDKGLIVKGGLVKIITGENVGGGSVTIDNNGITAAKNPTEKAVLDYRGLVITGGAFTLNTRDDGLDQGERIKITKDKIAIYGASSVTTEDEIISICKSHNLIDETPIASGIYMGEGSQLRMIGGTFEISDLTNSGVTITNNKLSVKGTETTGSGIITEYEVILDSKGLYKTVNGVETPNFYLGNCIVGKTAATGKDEHTITLRDKGFVSNTPKVVCVPVTFQTYNKLYSGYSQIVKVSWPTPTLDTGIKPTLQYLLERTPGYLMTSSIHNSRRAPGVWQELITSTISSTVTSFMINTQLYARGQSSSGTTNYDAEVKMWFSTDGSTWTNYQTAYCIGGARWYNSHWGHNHWETGSDSSWGGQFSYAYPNNDKGTVWVKIQWRTWNADTNVNFVQFTGYEYFCDTVIVDNENPEVYYIAIE